MLIEPTGMNHGYEFDYIRLDCYRLYELSGGFTVYNQLLDTLEYHFKHKPKNASIINFQEPFKATIK